MGNKKYKCRYCGRVMDSPSPHICTTGFIESKLWFKEIDMEERKQIGGSHYEKKKIQPKDYIRANDLDFFEGNIVKYITRHEDKDGAKDVMKVIDYAIMILEDVYGEKVRYEVLPKDLKEVGVINNCPC